MNELEKKASRRFYNRALKASVYDQCLVATANRFEALNTIPASEYYNEPVRRQGWTQTTWTHGTKEWKPPHDLAAPFRLFDRGKPKQNTKTQVLAKRPRTIQNAALCSREEVDEEKKRKKSSLFTRSVALQGQMRVYKVLMRPSRRQRRELKRCFEVARDAFNFANYRIRKHGDAVNFVKLRNLWTKEGAHDVATRIQQHAVKQCVDAYTSNFAKVHHGFEVKYRELHTSNTEIIVIEKDQAAKRPDKTTRKRFEAIESGRRSACLLHLGNNLAKHGGIRLQDSRKVVEQMLSESAGLKENAQIQWNKRLGCFYFIYAYEQPKLEDPDPLFERKRIVATDPGLSPFQQWYSPTTGEHGVLLDGAKAEKHKRCMALDHLQARIAHRSSQKGVPSQARRAKPKAQKRYRQTTRRMRRCYRRKCERMRNWMANGHYAAAHFLLEKHDIVIQPILQVKQLTDTGKRNFGSSAARAMYTWSHYLFRQRLKSAASRYPGRHVYETTEPGTSKTCTHCGFWHAGLKLGDKIYNCPRCHIQVDRQLAGARNNFFAAYGLAVGRGWDGVGD